MADETTTTAENVSESVETLDPTDAIGTVDSTLLGGDAATTEAMEAKPTEDSAAATARTSATAHVAQHAAGNSVEAYKPVFSADVRKTVYVVGLAVSFVAFVITGLSAYLPRVFVDTASLIGTGFGTLAAGFGVAYAGK